MPSVFFQIKTFHCIITFLTYLLLSNTNKIISSQEQLFYLTKCYQFRPAAVLKSFWDFARLCLE